MVMRSRAAVSSYHDAIPAAISKSTAPAPRAASPQSPVQGNIKKKRRSLMMAEEIPGPDDPDLSATDTDEPPREYGNPNKIAQFFPELSHFTNRG
jgi:glutamine amidotransferase